MLYIILYTAVWIFSHVCFRFRVVGQEHKIKGRGFVLCANHISMLDAIFVEVAWGGFPKFGIMGKAELFKNPFLAFLFRSVGVFPVNRGTGDTSAVDTAIATVEEGRGMLVFPEGTRSKTGELGKLKSGAFVVAAATGADMIPCRVISNTGKVRLFSRVTVAFGPVIPAAELAIDPAHKASSIRRAKETLHQRLETLLEENSGNH